MRALLFICLTAIVASLFGCQNRNAQRSAEPPPPDRRGTLSMYPLSAPQPGPGYQAPQGYQPAPAGYSGQPAVVDMSQASTVAPMGDPPAVVGGTYYAGTPAGGEYAPQADYSGSGPSTFAERRATRPSPYAPVLTGSYQSTPTYAASYSTTTYTAPTTYAAQTTYSAPTTYTAPAATTTTTYATTTYPTLSSATTTYAPPATTTYMPPPPTYAAPAPAYTAATTSYTPSTVNYGYGTTTLASSSYRGGVEVLNIGDPPVIVRDPTGRIESSSGLSTRTTVPMVRVRGAPVGSTAPVAAGPAITFSTPNTATSYSTPPATYGQTTYGTTYSTAPAPYAAAPSPYSRTTTTYAPPATMASVPGAAAEDGIRLVPAPDVPPGNNPSDVAPSQWFEVVRPGNGPIRIGRVSSTCVCVSVRVPKRHIAAGERALVEARIVSRPPANNLTYGMFVSVLEPVNVMLDTDVTIRLR